MRGRRCRDFETGVAAVACGLAHGRRAVPAQVCLQCIVVASKAHLVIIVFCPRLN